MNPYERLLARRWQPVGLPFYRKFGVDFLGMALVCGVTVHLTGGNGQDYLGAFVAAIVYQVVFERLARRKFGNIDPNEQTQ